MSFENDIGIRAYEECLRVCGTIQNAYNTLDVSSKSVMYRWNRNGMPSAFYLARLFKAGADIKYILTGERESKEDGDGKLNG